MELITLIQQSEELRKLKNRSDNRLQLITDALPVLISYVDRDLVYRFNNAAHEKWFGKSTKDIIGLKMEQVLGESAMKILRPYLNKVLSGESIQFEAEIPYQSGTRTIDAVYIPDFTSEKRVQGFYVLVTDISARKHAEQELRNLTLSLEEKIEERTELLVKSEHKFRTVLETAPDAMLVVSTDGLIEYANNQATLLFGYGFKELVGKSIEILVPVDLREKHVSQRAEYIKNPAVRPMGVAREVVGLHKNGLVIPVEICLGISSGLEEKKGFVIVSVRDVSTKRKTEEKIKAALVEKEILLREIHHRVKNNLNVVSSLLELQSKTVPESLVEVFRESQNRILSMALIHEKLYQSKNLSEVDFDDYVNELVPSLLHSYGINPERIKTKIDIEDLQLSIDTAIPCSLIISELVSNSLKHAFKKDAKGNLRVALRHDKKLGVNELVVQDDGVGIKKDVDIFKSKSLGLKLVSMLTRQLGGKLALDQDSGTRFSIRFLKNSQATTGDHHVH